MPKTYLCAWDGCTATTTKPHQGGWAGCTDIPPDGRSGFLCPEHRQAFEAWAEFEVDGRAPEGEA